MSECEEQLAAALARNAELQVACGEKYEALRDRAKKASTELGEKNKRLAAERDKWRKTAESLQEELDNLRDRVTAQTWPCDCGGTVTTSEWISCSNGRCGNPSQRPAIVRGSDDAGEDE